MERAIVRGLCGRIDTGAVPSGAYGGRSRHVVAQVLQSPRVSGSARSRSRRIAMWDRRTALGVAITIGFACLFPMRRRSLRLLTISLMAAMFSLMVLLVVAMDHPVWGR